MSDGSRQALIDHLKNYAVRTDGPFTLRSGEIWILRHTGNAQLTLEPSVYLEGGRLAPRATRQIVLAAVARAYATRVSWTLAKARETPDAVRDLEREDLSVSA